MLRSRRSAPQTWKGRKILITLGSTREHLDPVRFLSNGSSGRMGLALAAELKRLGARVRLVAGPGVGVPRGFVFRRAVSARDMLKAVRREFPACDCFFSVAAVADYRPARFSARKLEKKKTVTLRLVSNPDILASVARAKGRRICVGFSLENEGPAALKRARDKKIRKHCDWMVLNHPQAMESPKIRATLLSPEGRALPLGLLDKTECAKKICRTILSVPTPTNS
jgi:phosphopantothenoylcysteine decarboxylase/phosphopantothenate--cysteine ligase